MDIQKVETKIPNQEPNPTEYTITLNGESQIIYLSNNP